MDNRKTLRADRNAGTTGRDALPDGGGGGAQRAIKQRRTPLHREVCSPLARPPPSVRPLPSEQQLILKKCPGATKSDQRSS